jgi:hypothetical protein
MTGETPKPLQVTQPSIARVVRISFASTITCGKRVRRFRSDLFGFKVLFSAIQNKGVSMAVAAATRADLGKWSAVDPRGEGNDFKYEKKFPPPRWGRTRVGVIRGSFHTCGGREYGG